MMPSLCFIHIAVVLPYWLNRCQAAADTGNQPNSAAGSCRADENGRCLREPSGDDQSTFIQTRLTAGLSVDQESESQKSYLEEDFSSFDESYFLAFDETKTIASNCNASVHNFVSKHKLTKQLNPSEIMDFANRSCQYLQDLLGGIPTRKVVALWIKDLKKALQDQKPGFSQKMLNYLRAKNFSWKTVPTPPSLSIRDMMNRLGADDTSDQINTDDSGSEGINSLLQEDGKPLFDPKFPTKFDARTKWKNCASVFTHIRDQGNCGSCWAQAAAGVMDFQLCVATGGKFQSRISASFIASCWNFRGRDGCKGGNPARALTIGAHHGAPTEGCFPPLRNMGNALKHFQGKTGSTPKCPKTCASGKGHVYPRGLDQDRFLGNGMWFPGNYTIRNNVHSAMQALMQGGAVGMNFMVWSDFFSYSSGYYERAGGGPVGMHGTVAIGWEVLKKTDAWGKVQPIIYFIGVNSWGKSWGDDGLFKLPTNDKKLKVWFVIPVPFPSAQDALPVPKVNDPKIADRPKPRQCTPKYSVGVCGTCQESRQCRCFNGYGYCNETIKKCQCPDLVQSLEMKCGQTYVPIVLTTTTTTLHGSQPTPAPPPPAPSAKKKTFAPVASAVSVKHGACTAAGGCVMSPGFGPGKKYGTDELCNIVVVGGHKLHVVSFETESSWDTLEFNWLPDPNFGSGGAGGSTGGSTGTGSTGTGTGATLASVGPSTRSATDGVSGAGSMSSGGAMGTGGGASSSGASASGGTGTGGGAIPSGGTMGGAPSLLVSGGAADAQAIEGQNTTDGGIITWTSDSTGVMEGWKICVGDWATTTTTTTSTTTEKVTTTTKTTTFASISVFNDGKPALATCDGAVFDYTPNPGPNPAPGYHVASWGLTAKCASPAAIADIQRVYQKWRVNNPNQAKHHLGLAELGDDEDDSAGMHFGEDISQDDVASSKELAEASLGKPWDCNTHRRRRAHWTGFADGRSFADGMRREIQVFACESGHGLAKYYKDFVDKAGVTYSFFDTCGYNPSSDYLECRAEEVGLKKDPWFMKDRLLGRYHLLVCGYFIDSFEPDMHFNHTVLDLMRSCANNSLQLPAYPRLWKEPGVDGYECLLFLNHDNCGSNDEIRRVLLNYSTELQIPILQPPENWTWYHSLGQKTAPAMYGFKGGKFCGRWNCIKGCQDFNVHDQVLFFKQCHEPTFDVMKYGRWPWYR